jgi:ribonuclease Z
MFHAELKSRVDEDISILLSLDNHPWQYLCDCGEASMLTVKECRNIRGLFISHTHIDHFVNFDTVLRHQIGMEREVIICGPPDIARQVQARIRSYTWNLIEANAISYQIREIRADDQIAVFRLEPPHWELVPEGVKAGKYVLEDKDLQVQFVILDHKIPTIAYLFQEPDTVKIDLVQSGFPAGPWVRALKTAFETGQTDVEIRIGERQYRSEELFHLLSIKKGDSLGVIMDHAAGEANHARIKSLFTGCRQVLIESFYCLEDKALAEANFHSYSEASGAIMRACKVGEAVPVHFSRKYEEEQIERLRAEFQRSFAQ